MSREKTVKTGVVVTLPNPLKTVFKSTTQRVVDESDASLIAKAVKDSATQKAERELLNQELAKPSAARNQALMRKFGTQNLLGSIDKYPDLSKGDKYKIVITIPDDPNIPLEHRPTIWSVTIVIQHTGNEFNFVFPFSRANQADPSIAYKLDNYPVFLDEDYNVIVEVTEDYGFYEALLDWKRDDETYLDDRKQVFKALGIDTGDGKLDFRVRGQGFYVSSTKLKAVGVKPVKTPKKEETKPTAKSTGNVQKVTITDDVEYFGDRTKGMIIADTLSQRKTVGILGLDSTQVVEDLYIDRVYSNSRLGAPVVVLDEVVDGEVFGIVINGLSAAQPLLGKQRVSQNELNAWAMAKNKKVFAKYLAKASK